MKKIFLQIVLIVLSYNAFAQDFSKNLTTAKSSYSSGNLEDARFAMQQMLNDLDLAIGKEVLKMLPTKMESFASNVKNDNVTTNTGLTGVIIHRDYGTGDKLINLDIMSNSPLIGSLNAILSLPFVGNSGDGTQKTVKVQGYKGVLQKSVDTETSKTDFTLQIPLNSTLLTLTVPNSNEADVLKMANGIPVSQIAKMIQ
ncbi:hypothetical protein [Chryseosolibacter indicus]|uniref:DUF4251 domain-containing protein n=1 Tax=Chryseosolibacter indicus TaxID=2782351 RepID=A0ABS5VQL0_9BACT|nr:hypothetical protein [Chryseosolibacter indicus]MBT1703087.1 hypothetical protein [Chryseosolibacter indicus]